MARFERIDPHPGHQAEADRDIARRDKQDVTGQSASPQGETEVHYGKRFAETEAILKARAEERTAAGTEQPKPPDEHLGSTEDQTTPTPGPPATGAVADEVGMPGMSRGSRPARRRDRRRTSRFARERMPPLGATPSEEPPPAAEEALAETPAELIAAFRDQATRSFQGLGEAARQFRTAGREVAGLPVEALRIVIRVGRFFLGRSPRRV